MLHTQLTALALATTALAAAGCGSTSTQSSTGGSVGAPATTAAATTSKATSSKSNTLQPLMRAKLIAQADAICRRVNAKRATLKVKTQQDYARLVPPFASYEQAMYAKLDKLVPPASMAKDWTQILAQAKTLADNMTRVGEYAKTNKLEAAGNVVSSAAKAQSQMIVIAKRDGFKDCGRIV